MLNIPISQIARHMESHKDQPIPFEYAEILMGELQQAQAELASYKAGETLDGTVMYDYFACAYRLDIEGFLSGKDYARGQAVRVLVMKDEGREDNTY